MRIFWIVLSVLVATAALGGFGYYYWPLRLDAPKPDIQQKVAVSDAGTRVFLPNKILVAELADFDDGLFAFLMFDYLRGRTALSDSAVMLTSQEEPGQQPSYKVLVRLPDDLTSGLDFLAELKAERLTSALRFKWILPSKLNAYLDETSVFIQAYNGPASERLKALHASELQDYLRRFIRFKSQTDPRFSNPAEQVPSPLTQTDASMLAADIIAVAYFYDLPIDLFLGIGAMENNYMNVAGDLENTLWKRHVEPGDVVLKRARGRVLVRNDSMGVWQITRQSMRYAHKLYCKDKRDYEELPERLRPPKKFDFQSVDADVLTTYAGLLLRDLIDRFHGDVTLAAGAYNGGPLNPNPQYAAGVEIVANYARRVISRAAEMDRVALERKSVSTRKMKNVAAMIKKETPEAELSPEP